MAKETQKTKGTKEELRAFWPGDAALKALGRQGAIDTAIQTAGISPDDRFLAASL